MANETTPTSPDTTSTWESTNDVRVSITPDLYNALASLTRYAEQVDLPVELGQAVQGFLTSYEQTSRTEERILEGVTSLNVDGGVEAVATACLDDVPPQQHAEAFNDVYIPRSILVQVSQFARTRKSARAIERAGLDIHRYSIIALCAGTRTYTTAAQERLIRADPDAASHFLPSHLAHVTSSVSASAKRADYDSSSSLGQEYRSASKEISAVLNVLFSIGGVGGAVFVVAKTSAGMRQEMAVLLAFLAAIVVGIAETWLYVSHARRSAKRYAEGEEIRRAMERQAGPSTPVIVDEEVDSEGKENFAQVERAGDVVVLDNSREKQGVIAASTVLDLSVDGVHQTSRQHSASRHPEIRLRRKPLNGII